MENEMITRIENRVAYITFNRPKSMNAFTPEYLGQLIEKIAGFEADPEVRVIVLTGAGEAFSSGGDKRFLKSLSQLTPVEIRAKVYRYFGGAARALKLCTKPTVASVNGPAVGAGCELAVACDFRIVARDAFFCESWINLGIVPPLGGMFLLPRLVGLGRATDMVMRGVRVYGEEAKAIGLANEVTDGAELEFATRQLAEELASRAPLAMSVAKDGLRRGMESTLAGEWEFNVFAQSMLLNGADFAEAVAAMGEKRKPRF